MMLSSAMLFALCYVASLFAERVHQMLESGDEILRRAQGTQRPFVLIDWLPGQ